MVIVIVMVMVIVIVIVMVLVFEKGAEQSEQTCGNGRWALQDDRQQNTLIACPEETC